MGIAKSRHAKQNDFFTYAVGLNGEQEIPFGVILTQLSGAKSFLINRLVGWLVVNKSYLNMRNHDIEAHTIYANEIETVGRQQTYDLSHKSRK